MIDLYCERTGPGFWNEPLNAVSNLAFLMAAVAAWQARKRRQGGDVWEVLVILLAGLIGFGSFLFHSFATSWAEMADILPIWSFVAVYAVLTIYRSTDHNLLKTMSISVIAASITLTIGWFTANDLTTSGTRPPLLLNGSLQYTPALTALVFFSIVAWFTEHPARHYLVAASATFVGALLFRTLDLMTCTATQGLGTHFLWHLLVALMVGILLQAMVLRMPPSRTRT